VGNWYFEQLIHRGTRVGAKYAFINKNFCSSIPSLEFLILFDGVDKVGELFYMTALCFQHYSIRHQIYQILKKEQIKVDLTKNLKFLTIVFFDYL
jgi:hypothetical protein